MKVLLAGSLCLILACAPRDSNGEPFTSPPSTSRPSGDGSGTSVPLPPPRRSGDLSVEEALQRRRSVRSYRSAALSLEEIGQLLWAAQGITDQARGLRTAPSAGATFPLEVYLLNSSAAHGLGAGVYRYRRDAHALEPVIKGDRRDQLFRVSLRQSAITDAPVVMVITAVPSRIEPRYGNLAPRFIAMEAGHAAQNVYLQSVPLGIGTVVIGAFDEAGVSEVLQLPHSERPLYILPIGKL
jgi:SagB-type dehydrogenase family enzyme